jgi:hypothetical protein
MNGVCVLLEKQLGQNLFIIDLLTSYFLNYRG